MSNYMEDFEKELERELFELFVPDDEKDPSWLKSKGKFVKFVKDKLLQSYRNGLDVGLKAGQTMPSAKAKPSPSR
jgi:hypothetical protein